MREYMLFSTVFEPELLLWVGFMQERYGSGDGRAASK